MTNVNTLNNINRLEIKSNEYLSVWKCDEILYVKMHDRLMFRVSDTGASLQSRVLPLLLLEFL